MTRACVMIPLYVCGFSEPALNAYVILVGVQAVAIHANIGINFGFFRYIIATPQFHHWHHASDDAAIDRNYAAHFAFLDYLFGTAVKSKQEWPDAYGVVGDYVPDGLVKQQMFPFTWRKPS